MQLYDVGPLGLPKRQRTSQKSNGKHLPGGLWVHPEYCFQYQLQMGQLFNRLNPTTMYLQLPHL